MNSEYLKTLYHRLDQLLERNFFKNRYIAVFGANTPGDKMIKYLQDHGVTVNVILDNNILNSGKKMLGVPVCTPDKALNEYKKNLLVFITSRHFNSMKKQLEDMGYIENVHIFKMLDMNTGVNLGTEEEKFRANMEKLKEAAELYKKLINKDWNPLVFLCPLNAIGDLYLVSSYLKAYVLKENIKDYVMVVIGGACKKIAGLFSIQNVITITQQEMDLLVLLCQFLGRESKMKILQPYWLYYNILNSLEGYKNISFNDFIKYCIFDLPENTNHALPKKGESGKEMAGFFKDHKLKAGKTVILSPYANSLPSLPMEFWTKLAKKLKILGYDVCTNSAGPAEKVIPHTERVCFPLENLIRGVETAGFVIGLRSGFCDVISSANCKKIILYPDKACGFVKAINFYGLKNMELTKDVIEMEYDWNDPLYEDKVIQKINECEREVSP